MDDERLFYRDDTYEMESEWHGRSSVAGEINQKLLDFKPEEIEELRRAFYEDRLEYNNPEDKVLQLTKKGQWG